MALPPVHKAVSVPQQHSSLNKQLAKERNVKVHHKNILFKDVHEWPRPSKDKGDAILKKLSQKLESLPNIFKHTKESSSDNHAEKNKVRSQLEIGTSSVFRALEQDRLAGVLISGQATPAIAVDHIITLGRERNCPFLCIDQMAPIVATSTKSKCFPLAIGFKKVEDDTDSYFAEIISLIKMDSKMAAPPVSRNDNMFMPDAVSSNDVQTSGIKGNENKPLKVESEAEREIITEMKRVFSQIGSVCTDDTKNLSKKQRKQSKRKRNLKECFDKVYHTHFEVGKRTVTEILERNKLQVVLVSEKICPVLMSEKQSFSMLSTAARRKCPVIVISGLDAILRTYCGGSVSVIGFKKLGSIQGANNDVFGPLIEKCLNAVRSCNLTELSCTGSGTSAIAAYTSQPSGHEEIDRSAEHETTGAERGQREDQESSEEDYSHLYILKKESQELAKLKSEQTVEAEETQKTAFSADFISFSSDGASASSVDTKITANVPGHKSSTYGHVAKSSMSSDLTVGTKGMNTNTDTSSTLLFSVDRSRGPAKDSSDPSDSSSQNQFLKKEDNSSSMHPKDSHVGTKRVGTNIGTSSKLLFSVDRSGGPAKDSSDSPGRSSQNQFPNKKDSSSSMHPKDSRVLGLADLRAGSKPTGIDFISLGDSSKSAKKAMKRKMNNSGDFISFKYTETNIKTMTSNPSKKKKKKKRK